MGWEVLILIGIVAVIVIAQWKSLGVEDEVVEETSIYKRKG